MQTKHFVLAATVLFAILPAHPLSAGPAADLIVLDLRAALGTEDDRGTRWAYDTAKAIGALQGIVNREHPHLFVLYLNNGLAREKEMSSGEAGMDRFWLEWLREEERLLADREIQETTDVWKVLEIFQDSVEGLAVWDETVPSTANVASTLAGAEDLLPVRGSEDEGSLFVQIKERFPDLEVKRDLRGKFTGEGAIPDTSIPSTSSAKCDAYVWAVETLLKTGKCSSTHLAYYVDGVPWNVIAPQSPPYPDLGNAGVLNADYWISRKAFFFDLSPWEDRSATDDPNQPVGTDYRTLLAILQAANRANGNDRIITCGGFVPWWLKYCRSNWGGKDPNITPHEPVPTEWQFVDILSAYNTVLDADAFGLVGLANASVYRHYPSRNVTPNLGNRPGRRRSIQRRPTFSLPCLTTIQRHGWLNPFPALGAIRHAGSFPCYGDSTRFSPTEFRWFSTAFSGHFRRTTPSAPMRVWGTSTRIFWMGIGFSRICPPPVRCICVRHALISRSSR